MFSKMMMAAGSVLGLGVLAVALAGATPEDGSQAVPVSQVKVVEKTVPVMVGADIASRSQSAINGIAERSTRVING